MLLNSLLCGEKEGHTDVPEEVVHLLRKKYAKVVNSSEKNALSAIVFAKALWNDQCFWSLKEEVLIQFFKEEYERMVRCTTTLQLP